MITSKLTGKGRTTVPQPVRAALRLRADDSLVYEIDEDRVILTKAADGMIDDPFAMLEEWNYDADRQAYGGL